MNVSSFNQTAKETGLTADKTDHSGLRFAV